MLVTEKKDYITEKIGCFSLKRTLECGQCFRFFEEQDGFYKVFSGNKRVIVGEKNGRLIFKDTSEDEFENYWKAYFDLDRDYEEIDRLLCTDRRLKEASVYAKGIHILRQDPFETLCSFIISQNNNIPRIKGIIDRFCKLLGKPISGEDYAFPTAESISRCTVEDLAPIRAGFRAKYLIDAANKVITGEAPLNIPQGVEIERAEEMLTVIKGVGKKVADCVLLFSMGRMDAFPEDVWIKRIMAENFPDGLPEEFLPVRGIAQQYLYHFNRNGQK